VLSSEERMNNLIWNGDGMRNIGLVGRILEGGGGGRGALMSLLLGGRSKCCSVVLLLVSSLKIHQKAWNYWCDGFYLFLLE